MKDINIQEDQALAAFAEQATHHFNQNPENFTYANAEPKAGHLLAIRWNPANVLVIRLCEDFEPSIYRVNQFIIGDLPKLAPVD